MEEGESADVKQANDMFQACEALASEIRANDQATESSRFDILLYKYFYTMIQMRLKFSSCCFSTTKQFQSLYTDIRNDSKKEKIRDFLTRGFLAEAAFIALLNTEGGENIETADLNAFCLCQLAHLCDLDSFTTQIENQIQEKAMRGSSILLNAQNAYRDYISERGTVPQKDSNPIDLDVLYEEFKGNGCLT